MTFLGIELLSPLSSCGEEERYSASLFSMLRIGSAVLHCGQQGRVGRDRLCFPSDLSLSHQKSQPDASLLFRACPYLTSILELLGKQRSEDHGFIRREGVVTVKDSLHFLTLSTPVYTAHGLVELLARIERDTIKEKMRASHLTATFLQCVRVSGQSQVPRTKRSWSGQP